MYVRDQVKLVKVLSVQLFNKIANTLTYVQI